MKTALKILIGTVIASFLIWACSSNDDTTPMTNDDVSVSDDVDPNGNPNDPENSEAVEVSLKVILPEDFVIDMAQTTVSSLGQTFAVDADGSSNAFYYPEEATIAYLKNANQEILLMGFIDEDHTVLSIESTVKVITFFSLGTIFQPDEVKDRFFSGYAEIPGTTVFEQEITNLLVQNGSSIEGAAFHQILDTRIEQWTQSEKTIDIPLGIGVPDNSAKSGLSVVPEGPQSINFMNQIRRRAHAFLYKVASQKQGESGLTKILEIENNTIADKEIPIDAINGVTSLVGNTLSIISGSGQDVGFTLTEPIQLELIDQEIRAQYQARLIGASNQWPLDPGLLTEAELEIYNQILIKTVALDVIIPVGTSALGVFSTVLPFDNADLPELRRLLNIVTTIIASSPDALNALYEGRYIDASKEFFGDLAVNSSTTGEFFELIEFLIKRTGKNVPEKINVLEAAKGTFATAFSLINSTLTFIDAGRVFNAVKSSNPIETFVVNVTLSKVTITPPEHKLVVGKSVDLQAIVADGEETDFSYEWRTTGQYGQFNNNQGNSTVIVGNNGVTYQSHGSIPPDQENAIDSLFVDVYSNAGEEKVLIGKDSTIITVFPEKYRIKPQNATIKGDDILVLKIVDEQGEPFVDNSLLASGAIDYRIDWEISGQSYGLFDGTNRALSNVNKNSVNYHALDTKVERAEQVVIAKLFDNITDEPGNFSFVGEVETTIVINNTIEELYYYVPIGVGSSPPSFDGIFYNYGVWSVWRWNPNEVQGDIPEGYEVDRYTMKVEERIPDPIPSCTFNSQTWFPQNQESDLIDGNYEVDCFYSGGSTPFIEDANSGYSSLLSLYQSAKGYAKVTVYLKPIN